MAVTTGVSERVERLRASLEEPLLVTYGTNLQYLTGFQSSNAALFVDAERILLFTDFRYAEAARAIEGVDFVRFGGADVVRHRLVQRIVEAYDAHATAQATDLRPAERRRA